MQVDKATSRRDCATSCSSYLNLFSGRYVLADTEKLHSTLSEMSRRIRQLEDALQISHASVSTAPHPLLSEEQLAIKYGSDAQEETEKNNSSSDWGVYTLILFGTLRLFPNRVRHISWVVQARRSANFSLYDMGPLFTIFTPLIFFFA